MPLPGSETNPPDPHGLRVGRAVSQRKIKVLLLEERSVNAGRKTLDVEHVSGGRLT